MAKAMTKDAQIATLTETNASLTADVVSLSDAIGELEAEIVTERATAAAKVAEAQAKVRDALASTAGDAAAALTEEIEALNAELFVRADMILHGKATLDRLEEELRWEKGGRADDEEAADKLLAEAREEIAAKDEEIGKLEARIEELPNPDDVENAENEATDLRNALKDYLRDLGYASDTHWSNISCPHLRALAQAF